MRSSLWLVRAFVCTFALASSVHASGQTVTSADDDQQPPVPSQLPTFRQRAQVFGEDLISRKLALTASFMAGFGQFANTPSVPRQHFSEFPHRLGAYYGTHAARDAGEMLAGYLHHEAPQPRNSGAHGFWPRADAAVMSVLL